MSVAFNNVKPTGDFTQADQRLPFEFQVVSEKFVFCQVCHLKAVVKDAAHIVAKPLTVIINTLLHQAKVPEEWKSACVIPLFKKGDVNNMDNYHPISIFLF